MPSISSSPGVPHAYRKRLVALLDRLIPADGWPSATQAGAIAYFDARARTDHAALWPAMLAPGLDALDAEARAIHGDAFTALGGAAQDAVIAAAEDRATTAPWPIASDAFVAQITQLAAESYYVPRDAPSWRMIGYDAAPKRGPGAKIIHIDPDASPFAAATSARYDAIIVGAGAGGGVAAMVMAEAGAKVLLIDRGRVETLADVGRDHDRTHRMGLRGFNTAAGLDLGPRAHVDAAERTIVADAPHHPRWYANAFTVGGGTRVYQGMAWRFHPRDFHLASSYGPVADASVADWPLDYDELEPFYTEAEWTLGVCGDNDAHAGSGARSRPLPMPPLPDNREGALLRAAAGELGWSSGPVPLLINSVPRDGRAQCVQCGECVGFACVSDAKNGTHNTVIARALRTGNATLVAGARALRLVTDVVGAVTGVHLIDEATGAEAQVDARTVVVAAGAIETARLLLISASGREPDGIGNNTDQLGRHLQGHLYTSAFATFDEEVIDTHGPGVSIGTCDFMHGYPDAIGGGVLHNEVVKLPIIHWIWAMPPDVRRWGLANKNAMRDLYRRTAHVHAPVQEVPHCDSRVTLDPVLRDRHGIPVARTRGALHRETLRTARLHQATAADWLHAAGAGQVWKRPFDAEMTASHHQAGTCRMGDDPATSVTDRWGRVHGHANLWVMDGSLHVSNGGVNPVLSIYALAFRNARKLVAGGD